MLHVPVLAVSILACELDITCDRRKLSNDKEALSLSPLWWTCLGLLSPICRLQGWAPGLGAGHNQIWRDRAAGPPLANCRGGGGAGRGGGETRGGPRPALRRVSTLGVPPAT